MNARDATHLGLEVHFSEPNPEIGVDCWFATVTDKSGARIYQGPAEDRLGAFLHGYFRGKLAAQEGEQ